MRLRPAPHCRTPIEDYALEVEPAGHLVHWQQDPFGNWLARLLFPDEVSTLELTVGMVADLTEINPFDFFVDEHAAHFPFAYEPDLAEDLASYLRPVDDSADAAAWRERLPASPGGASTVQFLADLNAAVHHDVAYSERMEPGVQTPDETLRSAIGSCRDSAWLMVGLLRQYGLAARFVSGYLVELAADERATDTAALHAWAEVYLPGAGWVGIDPTSALFAGERHIPLAATPRPISAAPISGSAAPAEVSFRFESDVRRLEH